MRKIISQTPSKTVGVNGNIPFVFGPTNLSVEKYFTKIEKALEKIMVLWISFIRIQKIRMWGSLN